MVRYVLVALTLLVSLSLPSQLPAQDAEMLLKIMQEQSQPVEEHKVLAAMDGSWNCDCLHHLPGKAEPEKSKGKATYKLIMDGRFVEEKFEASYLGLPMTGFGLTGYDRAKKKYVGVWIDSFNTGVMPYEGDYDAATKTLTTHGEVATLGGVMKCKMVTRLVSPDEMHFAMSMSEPGGTDLQTVAEMTYRRAK